MSDDVQRPEGQREAQKATREVMRSERMPRVNARDGQTVYTRDDLMADGEARMTERLGWRVRSTDIGGALLDAGLTDATEAELVDALKAWREREA